MVLIEFTHTAATYATLPAVHSIISAKQSATEDVYVHGIMLNRIWLELVCPFIPHSANGIDYGGTESRPNYYENCSILCFRRSLMVPLVSFLNKLFLF